MSGFLRFGRAGSTALNSESHENPGRVAPDFYAMIGYNVDAKYMETPFCK